MIRGFLWEEYMFTKCFREYCNFLTRASRSEYWIFTILMTVINLLVVGIMIGYFLVLIKNGTLDSNMSEEAFVQALMTSSAFMFVFVLIFISSIISCPWYAVAIRRLHDVGKSSWWLLLNFVPIIGGICFFILTVLPGQAGENQWGPNPLETKKDDINQIGACGYYFKKAFAKTFNYSDKSSIEEYYGFGFVFTIIMAIYFIIAFIVGLLLKFETEEMWLIYYGITFIIIGLFFLVTLFPSIALMVRRLRDAGLSPYLVLLLLAGGCCGQIVGYILLILCSQPTKAEPKQEFQNIPPVNEEI